MYYLQVLFLRGVYYLQVLYFRLTSFYFNFVILELYMLNLQTSAPTPSNSGIIVFLGKSSGMVDPVLNNFQIEMEKLFWWGPLLYFVKYKWKAYN